MYLKSTLPRAAVAAAFAVLLVAAAGDRAAADPAASAPGTRRCEDAPAAPPGLAQDSARALRPDTASVAAADAARSPGTDTIRAAAAGARPEPAGESVWTIDELKTILGAQTEGFEGRKYRQRKNGRVAMLCALAFPGLGQMYNEKPLKAAIALGAETFYANMILQNRRLWDREKRIRDRYPVESSQWNFHDAWVREYWERSVDWIWWSAATVVVIMIDAYVDANLDDMRFGIEPRASADGAGLQFVVRY